MGRRDPGGIDTDREAWLLHEASSAGRLKIGTPQYEELRVFSVRLQRDLAAAQERERVMRVALAVADAELRHHEEHPQCRIGYVARVREPVQTALSASPAPAPSAEPKTCRGCLRTKLPVDSMGYCITCRGLRVMGRKADCLGCGKPLDPKNYRIADGCPCNSARGVNHGLVLQETCTCIVCDPAQTGSTRYGPEDWPPPHPPVPPPLDVEAKPLARQPFGHLEEDQVRCILDEHGWIGTSDGMLMRLFATLDEVRAEIARLRAAAPPAGEGLTTEESTLALHLIDFAIERLGGDVTERAYALRARVRALAERARR